MVRSLFVVALLATGTVLGSETAAQASPPSPEGPPEVSPSPTSSPPWDSSQPAPPGYHVERRINRGLVIAGSLVFGAAYLGVVIPSLILAANRPPSAAAVTVPVGGALYFLPVPGGAAWAAFDALVQAAGAGMLIVGLTGKRVFVPGPSRRSAVQLVPVPLRFGSNGAGLGIVGAF
jgi:hypothetical protein